jgi:hypothetical protein
MDHEPGRFVQNDHIPVFVENREGDFFGFACDRFRGRDLR